VQTRGESESIGQRRSLIISAHSPVVQVFANRPGANSGRKIADSSPQSACLETRAPRAPTAEKRRVSITPAASPESPDHLATSSEKHDRSRAGLQPALAVPGSPVNAPRRCPNSSDSISVGGQRREIDRQKTLARRIREFHPLRVERT